MLRVLYLICLTILYCSDTTHTTSKPGDPINYENNESTHALLPHEGFLPGTLIKTPSGYLAIENLKIDDTICGQHGPQNVLYIKQSHLNSYLVIKIENQYLQVAPQQQFYLLDGTLQAACNLHAGDQLQNQSFIYEIHTIDEPCSSYCISTQDQIFIVYPEILVHNFDVITLGTAGFTVSLGIIECSNPITILLGGVCALAWYATNYFKQTTAYGFEFDNEDPDLTAENLSLHDTLTIQETRSYYIAQRQALIELYQKLTELRSGMIAIIRPTTINAISFATNFLTPTPTLQFQAPTQPDLNYECTLSTLQKMQLLTARDQDLEKLQQGVFDLHLLLAFYINELIERRDFAQKEYTDIELQVNQEVNKWNYNSSSVPYDIALNHYGIHFLWQNALDNLETKTNEAQFVLTYYQSISTHFFIQKTTNVQAILHSQLTINKSIFDRIKVNRPIWHSNMLITEDYLRKHNLLSQQLINNIKSQIQQQRSAQEKEILNLSIKKKSAADNAIKNSLKKTPPQQTANIQGPEKDPDDDWFEKLKKNYEKKARTKQFGNIYKDPKTNWWYSKDRAGIRAHGGEHYKVFKETAKGLECVFEVDKLGNQINKHKGPIGIFIPYSDIIFKQ